MEIIEIGNTAVCAKLYGEIPKGRAELFSVAEKIFEQCGRRLYDNPEIAVYSNGASSLVFISRKMPKSILHNFAV